jgi:hypothetical protein
MHENGRIGAVPLVHPGTRIEKGSDGVMPREQIVRAEPVKPEKSPPRAAAGVINTGVLALEIGEQIATLRYCRIEVARQQRLPWNDVPAGRLMLHWTILPTGRVARAEVVAIDPLDLHVLDCVKTKMAAWTFVRPRGGSVTVDHPFSFRPSGTMGPVSQDPTRSRVRLAVSTRR